MLWVTDKSHHYSGYSYPFDFEPNGISFGSTFDSPRSYSIKIENILNSISLSIATQNYEYERGETIIASDP